MWEHVSSFFPGKPELSLDEHGMDAWGSQGIATAPACRDPVIPTPDWLQHSDLKNPWLYAERSTPNAHLSFTDIGDTRFLHTNGECPIPETGGATHPAIIINTPASQLHVKLEDITRSTNPKVLWDNWFSLKNTAPGGNGLKVIDGQEPMEPPEGESLDFIPFCFPSKNSIDFLNGTKYKLTVESLKDDRDLSITPFKDEVILRPRPMCDIVTSSASQMREFLS